MSGLCKCEAHGVTLLCCMSARKDQVPETKMACQCGLWMASQYGLDSHPNACQKKRGVWFSLICPSPPNPSTPLPLSISHSLFSTPPACAPTTHINMLYSDLHSPDHLFSTLGMHDSIGLSAALVYFWPQLY